MKRQKLNGSDVLLHDWQTYKTKFLNIYPEPLRVRIGKQFKQGKKWHSESADPTKALGPSDILDRNPVVDISDR